MINPREILDLIEAMKAGNATQAISLDFVTDDEIQAFKDDKGKSLMEIALENKWILLIEALHKRGITSPALDFSANKADSKELDSSKKAGVFYSTSTTSSVSKLADSKADSKEFKNDKEFKHDFEVLNLVNDQIKKSGKNSRLADCECCSQFVRDGKTKSVRDVLDEQVTKSALQQYPLAKYPTLTVLDNGTGRMKQTLTVVGNLMKAGYNVELIMIDHNFRMGSKEAMNLAMRDANLASNTAAKQNKILEEFESTLKTFESQFKHSVKVIGRFSSLESYKAVLAQKGPHEFRVRTHFDKNLGKKVPNDWEMSPQMRSQNASFSEEYHQFSAACRGKPPQIVTLIDDKRELGHAYGQLELDHMFREGKTTAEELQKVTDFLYDDLVNDICDFSNPDKGLTPKLETKQDSVLFITTNKSEARLIPANIPNAERVQVNVEAVSVSVKNPNQRQVLFNQDYFSPSVNAYRDAQKFKL